MLERTHMQSTGFDNVGPEGARTGFRIRMRQPNYRAVRVSLIEGVDVTINGATFPAETNRLVINGREYAHAELAADTTSRWFVGTTIDVIVDKPGGLEVGVHLVETVVRLRHPYFPPQFQPVPVRDSRYATIIT